MVFKNINSLSDCISSMLPINQRVSIPGHWYMNGIHYHAWVNATLSIRPFQVSWLINGVSQGDLVINLYLFIVICIITVPEYCVIIQCLKSDIQGIHCVLYSILQRYGKCTIILGMIAVINFTPDCAHWFFKRPMSNMSYTLQWRHNGRDGVSSQQPHDRLFNRLFRRRSKKKNIKLCVTGLCAGNSTMTGEFPAQMTSYPKNVSIWWRQHEYRILVQHRL